MINEMQAYLMHTPIRAPSPPALHVTPERLADLAAFMNPQPRPRCSGQGTVPGIDQSADGAAAPLR